MRGKVDFKELAVKYGERVGLGVALGLMLLLSVWGLAASGTKANKQEIEKLNAQVLTKVRGFESPKEAFEVAGVPAPEMLDISARKFGKHIPNDSVRFLHAFINYLNRDDFFRYNPRVLEPKEVAAAPVHLVYRVRMIDLDRGLVYVSYPGDAKDPEIKRLEPSKNDRAKWNQYQKQMADEMKRKYGNRGSGGYGMPPGAPPGDPGGGGGAAPPGGGLGGPPGGGLGGPPGGGLGGPPGGPPMPPGTPPGAGDPSVANEAKLNYLGRWIKIDDLAKTSDPIAETLNTLRANYVVASYPHSDQMKEIAKAMKQDPSQVRLLYRRLEIQRRAVVPKGTRMPDGKFSDKDLVFVLADGKWITKPIDPETGWLVVDPAYTNMELSRAVEKEEDPDPYVRSLLIGRITVKKMPKLVRGEYPKIGLDLPGVKAAYDELKAKGQSKIPPPAPDGRLPKDKFSPFDDDDPASGTGPGGGAPGFPGMPIPPGAPPGGGLGFPGFPGMPMPPGVPPGGGGGFAPPMPPTGGGGGQPYGGFGSGFGRPPGDDDDRGSAGMPPTGGVPPPSPGTPYPGRPLGSTVADSWPDFSLIRFLDLDPDIRPGQTYEYRLRVVLQNPNYKDDKDVANPEDAKIEELVGKWSPASSRVTFPEELHFYAGPRPPAIPVLRKDNSPDPAYDPLTGDLKPGAKKDPESQINTYLDRDKVAVQIHKWIAAVSKPGSQFPSAMGNWWVHTELVGKGDYIGKLAERPMVVWVPTQPDPRPDLTRGVSIMGVDFLYWRFPADGLATDPLTYKRALLVDYEGGTRVVTYFGGIGSRSKVREEPEPISEVLILDAKGRLIAKTISTQDEQDNMRAKRQTAWKEWVSAVKTKWSNVTPGGGGLKFGDEK